MADMNSPQDELDLRWSDRDRQAFPYLETAQQMWREWLKSHTPSAEQRERKLLMDLFVDYSASVYFGTEFRTAGRPEFSWFNSSVERPIESPDDYRDRTAPVQEYRKRMHAARLQGHLGRAMFEFIISGKVETSL